MESTTSINNASFWFIFQQDRIILCKDKEQVYLPDAGAAHKLKAAFIRQHKLGTYHQIDCFCAEIPPDLPLPDNYVPVSLRKTFEILGPNWYSVVVKAISIITWDRNHQYCGHCGKQTFHKVGAYERNCHHCGLSVYPRISPSIIVLISNGDDLLMARSPHFIPGAFGLIAGFVEAGENLEEAVHREVREEVSLDITNLRYFASQPWPFPDSLMVGFFADYAGGEIIIDEKEIEMANWYQYDNLPGRPSSSFSLSSKLIDHFIAERTKINLK